MTKGKNTKSSAQWARDRPLIWMSAVKGLINFVLATLLEPLAFNFCNPFQCLLWFQMLTPNVTNYFIFLFLVHQFRHSSVTSYWYWHNAKSKSHWFLSLHFWIYLHMSYMDLTNLAHHKKLHGSRGIDLPYIPRCVLIINKPFKGFPSAGALLRKNLPSRKLLWTHPCGHRRLYMSFWTHP